jgi:hypothetical protein
VGKLLEFLPASAAIAAVFIFPIYRLLRLPLAASVEHRVSARTRWKNFGLACAYVAALLVAIFCAALFVQWVSKVEMRHIDEPHVESARPMRI